MSPLSSGQESSHDLVISAGRAFPFTSVENVLSRLSLIRNEKLTNAAEVLFCSSGTLQLTMGLLADHARTDILDLRHGQSTLFSLVRAAEHYILVNTRRRFVIDDYGPRKEVPELPKEAACEILFNAYCHRDWLSRARVQIDIYHDAVEVTNPGWFIEGQDPKEHLASDGGSSLSRNMLIAQALYRSGDIEAYGSGIPRVRDACKEVRVRIEYARVPVGTKFVFHRNDAFASDSEQSKSITGRQMADKRQRSSIGYRRCGAVCTQELWGKLDAHDSRSYGPLGKDSKKSTLQACGLWIRRLRGSQ